MLTDSQSEAYGLSATSKPKVISLTYGYPSITWCYAAITWCYATITLGYFIISVTYLTISEPFLIGAPCSMQKKNSFFDFSLPYSRHPLQTPMYKGLEPRDPFQFSLPSPSRPGSLILPLGSYAPLWSESQKMGGHKLKNGRVTGGKIILPPVPQTPCTSAFERGHGSKGG